MPMSATERTAEAASQTIINAARVAAIAIVGPVTREPPRTRLTEPLGAAAWAIQRRANADARAARFAARAFVSAAIQRAKPEANAAKRAVLEAASLPFTHPDLENVRQWQDEHYAGLRGLGVVLVSPTELTVTAPALDGTHAPLLSIARNGLGVRVGWPRGDTETFGNMNAALLRVARWVRERDGDRPRLPEAERLPKPTKRRIASSQS